MKQFWSFVIICNALVWSLFELLGGTIVNTPDFIGIFRIPLLMYTPLLAAFLNSLIWEKRLPSNLNRTFGKMSIWHLVGLFLPLVIAAGATVVGLIFPDVTFSHNFTGFVERNSALSLQERNWLLAQLEHNSTNVMISNSLSALMSAWSFSALLALGEEFAWRGYLVRLLKNYSFWTICALVGPVWGLWHAPLILQGYNYPTDPLLGIPMMMLICTTMTPVMLYISLKSKSIWSAAIFHGSINSFAMLSFAPMSGGTNFQVGILSLSAALVFVVCCVIISMIEKKNLTELVKQF